MTATCKYCGMEERSDYMYRVNSPSRGYFYLCDQCIDLEECYSTKNNMIKGVAANHGLTFGFEFETSKRNEESNLLYEYGYIPTSDGSIYGTEWKSPVYRNLRGLMKMFRTFDDILYIGDDCGTHLNIGTFTSFEMDYIRRFYHSLFVPFSECLADYPEDCERVIGRYFNSYADRIDEDSDPLERYNFVNVRNSNRIEFRLCKYTSGSQYMNCIKLHAEIVKCIKKNFLQHFNDNRENIREFRSHKAKLTGKKIVRIFKKYAKKSF